MYSCQNVNHRVLFKRKLNCVKIYRYLYALIEKTDKVSHNGIFVFVFAPHRPKLSVGFKINSIYEGGFQTENISNWKGFGVPYGNVFFRTEAGKRLSLLSRD